MKTRLSDSVSILVSIVRSTQIKRALAEIDSDPPLNFWRVIYGNLIDIAVQDWCKIFGSNKEQTHWKKLVKDESKFRNGLLTALEIDRPTWNNYCETMMSYRNQRVAHHDFDATPEKYPDLDLALRSSYFYYGYLNKELGKFSERLTVDLQEYSESFATQAIEAAKAALHATSTVQETVN